VKFVLVLAKKVRKTFLTNISQGKWLGLYM